ncbi:MAG: arginine--tRNA ligase [Chloroflexota bacterium]|nr:arginine--tRNA ligase [Chloroflexota bacterium]
MTELVRDKLAALIATGLQAAQERGTLPEFETPETTEIVVEHSRQPEHGDYGSPVCLRLAREARMAPREIATRVVTHLPPAPFVGKVEVAGPGYINFTLDKSWLTARVEAILSAGESFGNLEIGHGQKAQVEFVSANPTGPLTVGRGRGGVMGDTLANLLSAVGYRVEREYYFNNAGRQMEILGNSVRLRYLELLGQEVDFPADHYQGDYIQEIAAVLQAEHKDTLADADVSVFRKSAEAEIFADIRATLARLGIYFDNYFNENSLYESRQVWHVLEMLRERGYVFEKEDATWFRATDMGGKKDRVLVRSNGEPTYRLPDIAYHIEKIRRGYGLMVTILGADHVEEYPDVLSGLQALGYDTEYVRVVFHQFVTLVRGGEQVKMSTRRGHFVTLDELIDEVGADAVRYFMLARSPDSHMEFDLDLAVEQSDRNPVYYIQYAHARIASILRHARDRGWAQDEMADPSILQHESELALIRKMLELPEVIAQATAKLGPHSLPFYAQELAATFHAFYRDCRVVSSDPADADLTKARLRLVRATKSVLARTLHLMGMTAPERM